MWKPAFAATAVALAFAIAAPAEAGPLAKIAVPRQIAGPSVFSKFNIALLNPQPLPPRWNFGSLLSARALNPQPLPPRFNTLNASLLNFQTLNGAAKIPVGSSVFRVPNVRPHITTTLH